MKSIIIKQNYIDGIYAFNGFTDVQLLNNIFVSGIKIQSDPPTRQKVFSQVKNNLFAGNRNSLVLSANEFINNILETDELVTVSSNEIRNNLAANLADAEGFETENGNKDYNPDNDVLFFGQANNSTDGQWRIRDDSPYKAMGTDSKEPGPFGGNEPYVLSGQPPIPVVYELRTEGTGNRQSGLPVVIKVKSY